MEQNNKLDKQKKPYPKTVTGYAAVAAACLVLFLFCACDGTMPAANDQKDITQETENTSEKDSAKETASDAQAAQNEADEEPSSPAEDLSKKHIRLRLDGSGKDVFALWGSGKPDYRYGPSIILNEDGSADAWFASPGDGKIEFDWITYRHSDDGGNTWGDEKVVLSPTPDSADLKSVCDPDVFYHDGYYYMGYTGTINDDGLCNNVFLARSENPDGPFEKWDGKGWGNDPVPIVYFNGIEVGWGVGEPSFVVIDDRLYLYNTLDTFSETLGWVRATEVRTADLNDPLWPADLCYEGISIYRNDCTDSNDYTYADSDSWDVAYLEDSHKFLALTTNRRFKEDSCLLYYESDDGISFSRVSELNTDVLTGCHNCGLMSDGSGHIGKDDRTIIGYAYTGTGKKTWGVWATRFVPVKIDYTDGIDRQEDGKENLKQPVKIDESLLGSGNIMLMTDALTYPGTVDRPVNIGYRLMNTYRQKRLISGKDITIEKYDPEMIRISDDNRPVPVREGITTVGVVYNGLRRDIRIRTLPEECDRTKIRYFYPVCSRYDISVNEPIILKIRPMAVFGDYEVRELTPVEIGSGKIEFRSSDPSVCRVEEDGKLVPVSEGICVITVQDENCRYTTDVYVRR